MDDTDTQDWSILATASRADERTRVIKHGDSFAVFDQAGAIHQGGLGEQGVYHEGTRFLSRFEIALGRQRPLFLNSNVRRDNVLVVDLANPDMPEFAGGALERDTLHMFESAFLWNGALYGHLRIHNFGRRELQLELSILFGADFADIFEVRGMRRERRGKTLDPIVRGDEAVLRYEGLDHTLRATRLAWSPAPTTLTAARASWQLRLAPHGVIMIELRAGFGIGGEPALLEFDAACDQASAQRDSRTCVAVTSTNRQFDQWMDRSASDLEMMVSETPHGPYPYAGVPWFSTPFGRDGILTAYEVLWRDRELARGVLQFLAATQADRFDRERDAEPGKIIHEVRLGEMAACREIPFGRYYGSVDATPLFVMLAGAYWQRTADRELVEHIWPHVERALAWIDEHGDVDGDGFVEYQRRSSRGLVSQGWKDSHDSISHRDGRLAEGPIALCEVQGYVYGARRAAAMLASVLGHTAFAHELDRRAETLRENFDRAFWCEPLGTYALALDGDKRPCEVRASNAGHCLWSGIARPDRARRVVETLLDERSFSGWGIRTLHAEEQRYNPLSYHNGSVWPHDNAIIAMGMARYGAKHGSALILSGLFDASHHVDLQRMPELFCGFRQRAHEGPTLYPVACAPQAWAAGAVFLALQACIGLEIDAPNSRIVFDRPLLPATLARLTLHGVRINDAVLDIVLERRSGDVGLHLERREGEVEVVVLK